MTNSIRIVIFDIDGCLSNDVNRLKHLPGPKETSKDRYDRYHGGMHDDDVIPHGLKLLTAWRHKFQTMASGAHNDGVIVFLTARPDKYINDTINWLTRECDVDFGKRLALRDKAVPAYEMLMRSEGDQSSSPDYKRAALEKYIGGLCANGFDEVHIVHAYDDRIDVVNMWHGMGIPATVSDRATTYQNTPGSPFDPFVFKFSQVQLADSSNPPVSARQQKVDVQPIIDLANPDPAIPPEIEQITDNLRAMADTLESRAADYGYNAGMVAQMMAVMFPNGVTLTTPEDFEFWHLFELQIVKLTRFVNSGMKHKDSLHDGAIYAAFCERLIDVHNIKINK